MAKVIIQGGKKLKGTVHVSGSKNSALPILAAVTMLEGESKIENIPKLTDITTMVRMLRTLGLKAEHVNHCVKISNNNSIKHLIPYELVTKMRASFFIAGPILAKTGFVKIPMPGGCAIGTRPVDIHLKGFEALGAKIEVEHGFIDIKAKKLKGNNVYLTFPSVGATENIMMAAALAEGNTRVENAAREPEIEDLANFLNTAGAKIKGAGTDIIEIEGVSRLAGVTYKVIPDRIEAGTLLLAGAITNGDITLTGINKAHLIPLFEKMREMGVRIDFTGDQARVFHNGRLKPIEVETQPYPGFPTDMQAQLMALLCVTSGTSMVKETIFENRFMHAQELNRMGANIRVRDSLAIINGVEKLSGAPVRTTDLRAGAALWLAGLVAEGETLIYDIEHVERGYDDLLGKLVSLGAQIRKA
ncbi:MAG: UDP-N-acetylglucosamine 1-carboxyvinyltransferase [Candidatus Margulisbacteria bacterium]|nr:UDP-N-acetylglucosamine 1-carboxyvinyltransferase [Candidatus Margulisiibacteriota bacterium]